MHIILGCSVRTSLGETRHTLLVQTTVIVGTKKACPLQNKCMDKDIVYQATISTNNTNDTKHCIGTFQERYRTHIKSFTHKKKYSNETELSKHIWHIQQNKTDFTINWSIIEKSISYIGASK